MAYILRVTTVKEIEISPELFEEFSEDGFSAIYPAVSEMPEWNRPGEVERAEVDIVPEKE
jgi:hypothetical protein